MSSGMSLLKCGIQGCYRDNAIYKDEAGNELSAKLGVDLGSVEELLGVTRLGLEPRRVGLHDSIDFQVTKLRIYPSGRRSIGLEPLGIGLRIAPSHR